MTAARDYAQAESAFIGSLLREPAQIGALQGSVTPAMIAEPHHRDIFKAIQSLSSERKLVSIPAIQSRIPPVYDDAGPAAGIIAALRANAEGAGPAEDYAELLRERESNRRIEQVNEWTAQEVKRGELPMEEIAARSAKMLQTVMEIASPVRRERLADAALRAVKGARIAGAKAETEAAGISTGVPALDDIVDRFYGLSFLIANQGEGKSALAAQIAEHTAGYGRPVLIFQFEMDAEEMGVREIAARTGNKIAQILRPQVDAFEQEEYEQVAADLAQLPLYIVDRENMTVRQIEAQCRAMERTTGLSLVIIDQLDKIKPESKHRDRFEKIEEITQELKALAKSMPHVTFLVLGQRTRGSQRRDDPTPEINDADGPGIERNADVILAIWFPANWLRRQRPKRNDGEAMDKWEADLRRLEGKAEAIVLKHRRRKAFGQCEMRFEGDRMRFRTFTAG